MLQGKLVTGYTCGIRRDQTLNVICVIEYLCPPIYGSLNPVSNKSLGQILHTNGIALLGMKSASKGNQIIFKFTKLVHIPKRRPIYISLSI